MLPWQRRLILLVLAVVTVGMIVTFGTSSVRTGIAQVAETRDEERRAVELDARIAALSAEVELRTSEAGILREALCFGPHVRPGTEVYAVAGVSGCVGAQPARSASQ